MDVIPKEIQQIDWRNMTRSYKTIFNTSVFLRAYPEIGDAIFKSALWIFKQQMT